MIENGLKLGDYYSVLENFSKKNLLLISKS